MINLWKLGVIVPFAVLATTGTAHAYTIENAFSTGCHEQITSQALRAVRTQLTTARPLPATPDEQALINDVQFTPASDMGDLGGTTLLIAVRDNDLKGRGSGDLSQLAEVHGDPADQREHCLRSAGQDEPLGTQQGLSDCRAFILQRVNEALDALDPSGEIDRTKHTDLPLHLSLRGGVTASLLTFYVRIGQAIHAVEDSFTHTYRSPDGTKITVMLNWVEIVDGNKADESVGGPLHLTELDRCDDPDDLRKVRREHAVYVVTQILHATLDPAQSREAKLASVNAVLDQYLGYQAGCTYANHWCNAPEAAYAPGACGCGIPTNTTGGRGIALFALVAGGVAFTRRRTTKRKAALASSLVAVALFSGGAAHAQSEGDKPVVDGSGKPLTPIEKQEIAPLPTKPVAEPGSRDTKKNSYGFYTGLSGAVDKSALAITVGARVRTSPHWAFGLDGEWNPWISLNGTTFRQGTVNVYGTAILRFPLAYENFNLRTTANFGGSYLIMNLYGAPTGSLGLYVGLSPLGLEWKASRSFYLILNPINIAIPAPQLKGVPLLYPQYRFTIGLEFDTG